MQQDSNIPVGGNDPESMCRAAESPAVHCSEVVEGPTGTRLEYGCSFIIKIFDYLYLLI